LIIGMVAAAFGFYHPRRLAGIEESHQYRTQD
jgi:hypothetical protein